MVYHHLHSAKLKIKGHLNHCMVAISPVFDVGYVRWTEEILHQLIDGFSPSLRGFQPPKVVQDFFHPQYGYLMSKGYLSKARIICGRAITILWS